MNPMNPTDLDTLSKAALMFGQSASQNTSQNSQNNGKARTRLLISRMPASIASPTTDGRSVQLWSKQNRW